MQAQMAVLHNLAVLIVLSAVVCLALRACITTLERDDVKQLIKYNNIHWSNQ